MKYEMQKEGRSMNRSTLLKDALQTRWFNVVLVLVLALCAQSALAQQSINLVMNEGVLSGNLPRLDQSVSFEVADAEVATLNSGKGHIWIYGNKRLRAYQVDDGSRLIDQHHPDLRYTPWRSTTSKPSANHFLHQNLRLIS
jgi:hypothetical protein